MQGIALAWPIAAAVVLVLIVAFAVGRPVLARLRRRRATRALKQFRLQREQLEAHFFNRVGSLGKPRGLRWLECDWQSDVTFGRDVKTGILTAFVGVNIRFESLEGGDMEGVEAVGMVLRCGGPVSLSPRPLGNRRPGALQHESLGRPGPLQGTNRAD